MKQISLTFFTLLAFVAINVNAQSSSTDFFFGYKKSSLTAEHSSKLEELYEANKGESSTFKIIAYCDSVGGQEYNVRLGQARLDLFVKFFANKGITGDRISSVNNGSTNPLASNDTEEGRTQNRRVIVQVFGEGTAKEAAEPEEVEEEKVVVQKEACSTDTLIDLTGGAKLKMNICEFNKYSSCFSVNIYNSPNKLKESPFTTMGMSGQVMSTSGIVEVALCNDSALKHNLTVYVPVDQKCKPEVHPDLWTNFGKGVWNLRISKAPIDSIKGRPYYTYSTKVSNEANFASHINTKPEFVVKAKKGLKLREVTVYYGCEMGVYHQALEEPSKKMKIELPCPDNVVHFDIVAENKAGEEVKLTNLSSMDIKAKGKQKPCESKEIKRCYYIYPNSK